MSALCDLCRIALRDLHDCFDASAGFRKYCFCIAGCGIKQLTGLLVQTWPVDRLFCGRKYRLRLEGPDVPNVAKRVGEKYIFDRFAVTVTARSRDDRWYDDVFLVAGRCILDNAPHVMESSSNELVL